MCIRDRLVPFPGIIVSKYDDHVHQQQPHRKKDAAEGSRRIGDIHGQDIIFHQYADERYRNNRNIVGNSWAFLFILTFPDHHMADTEYNDTQNAGAHKIQGRIFYSFSSRCRNAGIINQRINRYGNEFTYETQKSFGGRADEPGCHRTFKQKKIYKQYK